MPYSSKYFNLSSPSKNWSLDDFSFAVEVLESLPRETLFNLLDRYEIKFNVAHESLDDEEIIAVLFDDAPKVDLLEVLRRIEKDNT